MAQSALFDRVDEGERDRSRARVPRPADDRRNTVNGNAQTLGHRVHDPPIGSIPDP